MYQRAAEGTIDWQRRDIAKEVITYRSKMEIDRHSRSSSGVGSGPRRGWEYNRETMAATIFGQDEGNKRERLVLDAPGSDVRASLPWGPAAAVASLLLFLLNAGLLAFVIRFDRRLRREGIRERGEER